MSPCPFCAPDRPPLAESQLAIAFADGRPASPGHTLVVPRRHVEAYFDCTHAEKAALWDMLERVRALLDASHRPDGYNVGLNIGVAAGQTVMHAHIHVIPRYVGDVADPRGGVRNVVMTHQPH